MRLTLIDLLRQGLAGVAGRSYVEVAEPSARPDRGVEVGGRCHAGSLPRLSSLRSF
jgi:hypothetical protein